MFPDRTGLHSSPITTSFEGLYFRLSIAVVRQFSWLCFRLGGGCSTTADHYKSRCSKLCPDIAGAIAQGIHIPQSTLRPEVARSVVGRRLGKPWTPHGEWSVARAAARGWVPFFSLACTLSPLAPPASEQGFFSGMRRRLGQELVHLGDWCEMRTHRGWSIPRQADVCL